MNRITFIKTAVVLPLSILALTALNGCLKSTTSPDTENIPLANLNLAGMWYSTHTLSGVSPPYSYNEYLNISSTDSTYYSIMVELQSPDTIEAYLGRGKIIKSLGKNLFLVHRNPAKGNSIDIDFTSCPAAPKRCPAHYDTVDIGFVVYMEKIGSSLRDGNVKTYIGDGSGTLTGKFYSLRYIGGQWVKNTKASFSFSNGLMVEYGNDGVAYDSGVVTKNASSYTYKTVTNQYAFIGDTLHAYGSSASSAYASTSLDYQPSDKTMPGQLFQ
jgi:hypothetical protein